MTWEEYSEETGDIAEYDTESFCYELLAGEQYDLPPGPIRVQKQDKTQAGWLHTETGVFMRVA
jgi:hypothetical protein